jgi:ornithine cyclodeaminase/alanine dehydrogenase-like protein (mu-crystallin family)
MRINTGTVSERALSILSDKEVQEKLHLPQVIEAIESAFNQRFESFQMPPRLLVEGKVNRVLVMPCQNGQVLGIKIITLVQRQGHGDRVLNASYTLYDGVTGHPLLLLEADTLTTIRTAAVSAVATRALARPSSSILGIFGTGRIASAHVDSMMQICAIKQVLITSQSEESMRRFVAEIGERHGIRARAVSADECAAESDIICTCTTARTPLFDGKLLRKGTHINAVGAFTPSTRELDTTTVARARIVVDTYDGALREAGDLLVPISEGAIDHTHIVGDLHEILTKSAVARRSDDDITLFKSVGCALEDLVAAELVLNSWSPFPSAEEA